MLGGWEITEAATHAPLVIADLTPYAKVLVRAAPDQATAIALGCPPGRAVHRADGELVVRTGPDEWLVLGPAGSGPGIICHCSGAGDHSLATVIDVTHRSVLLRLSGEAAPRLLEKVCAIDLGERNMPDGSAACTSIARVFAVLVRDDLGSDRSYLVQGDCSSGGYLFDTLVEAGEEFGIGIGGYRDSLAR